MMRLFARVKNLTTPHYFIFTITLVACVIALGAFKKTEQAPDLEKGFLSPPDSVKPSIYWYWLSDNISEEGVAKDIQAMSSIGIGRAFIGNIGLDETPYGNKKIFSEAWWKVTHRALREATQQNIEIGLFNGPGWSQSGGPWIGAQQTMRYLGNSTWKVKGPQKISRNMELPDPAFQRVTTLAFPFQEETLLPSQFKVTSATDIKNITYLMDGDAKTKASFPATDKVIVDIKSERPEKIRSITFSPHDNPFRTDVEIQVRQDDRYTSIKQFEINRQNPSLNVGFIPYAPVSISVPDVAGTDYRIIFGNIQGTAGFSEIELSSNARVERYMEKQLAKMYQTPLPLWHEYQWALQPEHEGSSAIAPDKVINLDAHLAPDGTLTWDVPKGEWMIVQFGMIPTGVTNAPASTEGRGPEVDKMSKEALAHHFDSFVGKILERIPPEDRRSFKWVVADSYETGSQNWTDGFIKSFKSVYGYDPIPWLPVLTGRVVSSVDQSDRFLWDLRRLIADQVSYNYVGGLRELSHAHGLKVWLENYGHWGFPGEFLQYGGQSDEIGGEFWNEGELGNIECRAASSAAHIYGKTKVAAESFTAGGGTYIRHPAMLKKRGDWSFTEGINITLLHVYITQPYEDRSPGVNTWFGTEFNRKNTWFEQSKAFIDYIRRCNFMLQQGKPVNDVAYFIGEDAPKMTGVRNPAIPNGYSYDYINAEVLLNRATVKDGMLTLRDGMSYRMLVLPQLATMRPELLKKLRDLIREGAVVVGPAPKRSPSLQHYPTADKEINQIAAEVWQNVDGVKTKSCSYGKGKVFNGVDIPEVFNALKVAPDFTSPAQQILYTHRRNADTEIYFITNQSDASLETTLTFRVHGLKPEWWDAVTGNTRDLPNFSDTPGGTSVAVKLEPAQSAFIVFRKPGKPNLNTQNFPKPSDMLTIAGSWKVSFDSSQSGPTQTATFKTLSDWSAHADENIKYYSGSATYRNTFVISKLPTNEPIYLDLGQVEVMAKVKINGTDVGTVWTNPYQVDITRALKTGNNTVEIQVVNTWVNRLIGDSKLPADQRKTWINVNPYNGTSELDPSGLVGPVKVKSFNYGR